MPVIVAHFRGFGFPVGSGVLDYAEGVDPEVLVTHAAGDGYGVVEGAGEGGCWDGFLVGGEGGEGGCYDALFAPAVGEG